MLPQAVLLLLAATVVVRSADLQQSLLVRLERLETELQQLRNSTQTLVEIKRLINKYRSLQELHSSRKLFR